MNVHRPNGGQHTIARTVPSVPIEADVAAQNKMTPLRDRRGQVEIRNMLSKQCASTPRPWSRRRDECHKPPNRNNAQKPPDEAFSHQRESVFIKTVLLRCPEFQNSAAQRFGRMVPETGMQRGTPPAVEVRRWPIILLWVGAGFLLAKFATAQPLGITAGMMAIAAAGGWLWTTKKIEMWRLWLSIRRTFRIYAMRRRGRRQP
jgi:hypothetical protein